MFDNSFDLFFYHNTLTTDEIGDGAILVLPCFSVALIWGKKSIHVFRAYVDTNSSCKADLLKFGSVSAVSDFFDVQGFCSPNRTCSINYFKIKIQEVDFRRELISQKCPSYTLTTVHVVPSSRDVKIKKAVLGTFHQGNIKFG